MKRLFTFITLVHFFAFTSAQVPQHISDSLQHILEIYQGS